MALQPSRFLSWLLSSVRTQTTSLTLITQEHRQTLLFTVTPAVQISLVST
jgi:hypothetical protein